MTAHSRFGEADLRELERRLDVGDISLRDARQAAEPAVRNYPVAELKAATGSSDAPGTFEAIVSVFGNVDSYGDRMMPGAFTRTLQPPPEGRGLPPVVWSHEWQQPPVGASLIAEERPEGLYVKARLLVGREDHPTARAVWAAMLAQGGDGRPPLREFSFGFRTLRSQFVADAEEPNAFDGEVRELLEVELYEVGPTLVGANPATELLTVKSRLARHRPQGPALDLKRRQARAQITSALLRRPTQPKGNR